MTKVTRFNRRRERQWKTKKAKKAQLYILLAILFMLAVQTVQYLFQPKTLVIQSKPMSWDTRESAEKATNTNVASTHEDSVLVEGALEERIKEVFPEDPHTALAIAKAESGLKTEAVGDGHIMYLYEGKPMGMSCGVFQVRVLPGRPSCEELKDIGKNLEAARKIYESRGWEAWSVYTNNAYKKFL